MITAKDENNIITLIDDAIEGKVYYCRTCGQPLIQKKGEIKAHHFAHKPNIEIGVYRQCNDIWQYDMTEWHIEWQKRFPTNCIEKVLTHGKQKHIADVAINNIVIEFQHSNISLSDFQARNNFYKNCGYHVVWLFDLIEDFGEGNIYVDDEVDNKYHWYNVKKMFRDLDLKEEEITLYFQFYDEKNEAVIERVTGGYKYFSLFYTDSHHALTIDEFVKEIQLPNSSIVRQKRKKHQSNFDFKDGKTIFEIWKKEYEWMVVKNLYNEKEMLIRGKRGEMYRQNYNPDGLILGRYSNRINGKYEYSKMYPVWEAEEPIWKLITYSYLKNNNKCISDKKENENKVLNILGYFTLNELIRAYPTTRVFYCEYNKKYYYLDYLSKEICMPVRFNAFEFDIKTGEIIGDIHQNGLIYKLKDKKVWAYKRLS